MPSSNYIYTKEKKREPKNRLNSNSKNFLYFLDFYAKNDSFYSHLFLLPVNVYNKKIKIKILLPYVVTRS